MSDISSFFDNILVLKVEIIAKAVHANFAAHGKAAPQGAPEYLLISRGFAFYNRLARWKVKKDEPALHKRPIAKTARTAGAKAVIK